MMNSPDRSIHGMVIQKKLVQRPCFEAALLLVNVITAGDPMGVRLTCRIQHANADSVNGFVQASCCHVDPVAPSNLWTICQH